MKKFGKNLKTKKLHAKIWRKNWETKIRDSIKKIQDKKFLNKKYQENKSEKINKILSLIKRASRGKKKIEKGMFGLEEIWLW